MVTLLGQLHVLQVIHRQQARQVRCVGLGVCTAPACLYRASVICMALATGSAQANSWQRNRFTCQGIHKGKTIKHFQRAAQKA